MDHKPDHGFVGPCGDLGSGPSPLSLSVYDFPGQGETLQPWHGKILLSSVHTWTLLLVCVGKTGWKTEGLVPSSSEYCIPFSGLSYTC